MPVTTDRLAAELAGLLATRRLGRAATILDSTPSTQDEAHRLAAGGASEGTLVWALEQTRGRGRLERAWTSPAGAGLWFSLVLRPRLPPDVVPWLTLAAGVGCATALRGVNGADVRLKWPNDLLLGGSKVGGILAEAESGDGAIRFVILGVGVNLRRPDGGFDPAINPPPAALEDIGALEAEPAAVMAALLGELEGAYHALGAGDVDAIRSQWIALSDTIGRRVSATVGDGKVEGVAAGLGADGALLLDGDDGVRSEVRWGEVIHLR